MPRTISFTDYVCQHIQQYDLKDTNLHVVLPTLRLQRTIRQKLIRQAQTEDKLLKCRICSPVDGTVLTKYVEEGEMVTSGKPLFTVADMDHPYVKAYFSSAQLAGLHIGDKVRVIPDDGTRTPEEYQGTVTWISSEAEFTPKNIQTRDERADLVYAVKVAIENGQNLRLGMYAYVLTD